MKLSISPGEAALETGFEAHTLRVQLRMVCQLDYDRAGGVFRTGTPHGLEAGESQGLESGGA